MADILQTNTLSAECVCEKYQSCAYDLETHGPTLADPFAIENVCQNKFALAPFPLFVFKVIVNSKA